MQERSSLIRDLEAVLFAAGGPVDLETLVRAASPGGPVSEQDVTTALERLANLYPVDGPRGFELSRRAEGWLFRTNRLSEPALSAAFDVDQDLRLSPAALEALAVVAYLQPVSRPEIAEMRGVNSDSAVQTLLDRELIEEAGRRDDAGGALLFATTTRFQVAFGLNGLAELPPLEGFAPGVEEQEELRRRLGLLVSPE